MHIIVSSAVNGWKLDVPTQNANSAKTDQRKPNMVDYDIPYGILLGEISVPMEIPDDPSERESLSQDPHRMCLIAFSRREKLPDDLHQAMIMWSFHPELSYCTKSYIEFLDFMDSISHNTNRPLIYPPVIPATLIVVISIAWFVLRFVF